jgi:hypothetical protein
VKRAMYFIEAENMTAQQNNQPITKTANRPQPYSQQRFNNQQTMTEERIKQIVTDTLIELNLVPQPQKKKGLADV